MSKREGPAAAGDNDPALRAEKIGEAISEILGVEADRREHNAKLKRRRDKAVGVLKGMGFKMADLAQPIRRAQLRDQAENAEKAEDRQAAKDAIRQMDATYIECMSAIDETPPDQMDFMGMLDEQTEARKKQFSQPQGKTKTKGGGAAAPN